MDGPIDTPPIDGGVKGGEGRVKEATKDHAAVAEAMLAFLGGLLGRTEAGI